MTTASAPGRLAVWLRRTLSRACTPPCCKAEPHHYPDVVAPAPWLCFKLRQTLGVVCAVTRAETKQCLEPSPPQAVLLVHRAHADVMPPSLQAGAASGSAAAGAGRGGRGPQRGPGERARCAGGLRGGRGPRGARRAARRGLCAACLDRPRGERPRRGEPAHPPVSSLSSGCPLRLWGTC